MVTYTISLMRITTEFLYTILLVTFCTLIYIKTKEIYKITQHKGIKYFRYVFLLFALTYIARLFFALFHLGLILTQTHIMRFGMLSIIPVGYLSTLTIFYLAYSLIHNKIPYDIFLISANLIATIITILAFITRNPLMIFGIQFIIMSIVIIFLIISKKNIKNIYLLLALFWLINLINLPYIFTIIIQIISIIIFATIYYKVKKWIK